MHAGFAEIVDYAGLFPPASCSMAEAVRHYDRYRRSPDRWMLGRFVVAATRLTELTTELGGLVTDADAADPWQLSVTLANDVQTEIRSVVEFASRWRGRGVTVDAVEYRVDSPAAVVAAARLVPKEFRQFVEVPPSGPYEPWMTAIRQAGAMAKLRTGGMTPALFPPATHVVEFLLAAVEHRVPFKATAGLHHPLRGDYPISYAPDAAAQTMYGFVNVLLATAELSRGGEADTAQAILEESDDSAIVCDGDVLAWRDHSYGSDELASVRSSLFLGFGSCSFREPVDELQQMQAA